jgi:hypothetical protein
MTLQEFRDLVHAEFGEDLEHMTPANVRDFLERLSREHRPPGTRYQLNESKNSYEAILRDFFRQTLDVPPEQAVIPLWTLALELAYADLREVIADHIGRLFGPGEGE